MAWSVSLSPCLIGITNQSIDWSLQTFTIGRGNELVCAAIDMLAPLIINRSLSSLLSNF
jgi:L-galactonate dehydratase